MSKKELKTNAMRMLERQKIPYEYKTYECEEFVSGVFTADQTGLPHETGVQDARDNRKNRGALRLCDSDRGGTGP